MKTAPQTRVTGLKRVSRMVADSKNLSFKATMKPAVVSKDVYWLSAYINVFVAVWTLVMAAIFWFVFALVFADAQDTAWYLAENICHTNIMSSESAPGITEDWQSNYNKSHLLWDWSWQEHRELAMVRYLNAENKFGDTWEKQAYAKLTQTGGQEFREMVREGGIAYARLLRLPNHVGKNNEAAALSIVIPMNTLWSHARSKLYRYGLIFGLVWLAGCAAVPFSSRTSAKQAIRARRIGELKKMRFMIVSPC